MNTPTRRSVTRSLLARRRERNGLTLNTAAMIDIVFLLLVYFLLIAEFRRDEAGFTLDAPASQRGVPADPFALPEPPILIRVAERTGGTDPTLACDSPLFDGALSSITALGERSRALKGDLLGPGQAFVIVSAERARWDDALGVLNALRIAGYEQVRMELAP